MEIKELTAENVWNLSEEEAFHLTEKIMKEVKNKEEKNAYIKIISLAFDYHTVSKSKKAFIESLIMIGFQFFAIEGEKTIFRGICKRKKSA